MKIKEWARRLLEHDARRIGNFKSPHILNGLMLLFLILVDVVAVKVGFAEPLVAVCAYLSALTLLVELLEKAFFEGVGTDTTRNITTPDGITKERNKIFQKWLKREPLTETERRELKLHAKQYFASLTFYWYVGHLRRWLRKALILLPWTAWAEERDIKADTYLLRLWAFLFLLLAVNFDIVRRVFS